MPDFFQQTITKHLDLIERLAHRRFESLDPALIDEAVNYVLDALKAHDYAILRDFQGAARLTTYLTTVVTRQLENFARTKFGVNRVPPWVTNKGLLHRTLYKLLCWQRQSLHGAVAIAANLFGCTDATEIERAAREILGRYPRCGQTVGPAPCDAETLPEPAATATCQPHSEDLSLMADPTHGNGARFAAALFIAEPGRETPASEAHARLIERLNLSPTKRWILTLEFRYGFSVAAAARRLGLTVHQAHGQRHQAFIHIRQAMNQAGLDPELELLP